MGDTGARGVWDTFFLYFSHRDAWFPESQQMPQDEKKYRFITIHRCEMCGDSVSGHQMMGMRMNRSQGLKPKEKTGISVSVVRCKNCGLIYSDPMPVPADLMDHYGTPPEDYWKEKYFTLVPEYFRVELEEAAQLLGDLNGKKALDIGAGIGKAMVCMQRKGLDVYGLEPSSTFYEKALSHMGIQKERLIPLSVEEAEFEDNFFDYISFSAVYEHLYEPRKCLERALKWLKPGGIIHIKVPSSDWLLPSFINRFYRLTGTHFVTNLSPMHPPYHLYEFTYRSFSCIAKELNYSIVMDRYDVCDIYFVPRMFHGLLRRYMNRTKTGMQLTVYLKKNS
jgi:2-polyprenyl-3-methyl-5-hydroxy-6-metoxy-1,4-benzoquinol methylase